MSRAVFAWHGGRLGEARAAFGDGPEPWIDLSTGINPLPWPGARVIAPDWHSLPDPASLAALEAIVARHFGVDPALCCAVPGSERALRLLGKVTGLSGAHLAPAYRTHAIACPQAIDFIKGPSGEARLLLPANPNNPDGRIVLPGVWAYRAVNMADSLIGHPEPPLRAFGWASARADDLANLPPARVAPVLPCLTGGGGWRVMWRDGRRHASPNAGWPEAAMAGALYHKPWIGDGAATDATTIRRALSIYGRACAILGAMALGALWLG